VCAALQTVFTLQPQLRSYIVDDQNRLRRNVTIIVDNNQIRDRLNLTDKIASEIYVVQASSGG